MDLNPGDRPFESRTFRIIWGIYLAFTSGCLMMAADIRAGNFGGTNYLLPIVMMVFGLILANIFTTVRLGKLARLGLCLFSGLGFGVLVWMGYMFLPGLQASSQTGPFIQGTLIYMGAITIVVIRLQRPVSPPPNDYGMYNTDLSKIYFNNSWRMFQTLLSLSAIVVAGILISVGTLLLQRQEVIIQPLIWFVGGILASFLPLITQLWYEMKFLEKAYKY